VSAAETWGWALHSLKMLFYLLLFLSFSAL
jgi:hypothetical protein